MCAFCPQKRRFHVLWKTPVWTISAGPSLICTRPYHTCTRLYQAWTHPLRHGHTPSRHGHTHLRPRYAPLRYLNSLPVEVVSLVTVHQILLNLNGCICKTKESWQTHRSNTHNICSRQPGSLGQRHATQQTMWSRQPGSLEQRHATLHNASNEVFQ